MYLNFLTANDDFFKTATEMFSALGNSEKTVGEKAANENKKTCECGKKSYGGKPFKLSETKREDDCFTYYAVFPGIDKNEISITANDDTVTLEWEVRENHPLVVSGKHKETIWVGKRYDFEKAVATCTNGLFTLSIPKKEETKKVTTIKIL